MGGAHLDFYVVLATYPRVYKKKPGCVVDPFPLRRKTGYVKFGKTVSVDLWRHEQCVNLENFVGRNMVVDPPCKDPQRAPSARRNEGFEPD